MNPKTGQSFLFRELRVGTEYQPVYVSVCQMNTKREQTKLAETTLETTLEKRENRCTFTGSTPNIYLLNSLQFSLLLKSSFL